MCLAEGGGPCAICLRECRTSPLPPDLACGGLPCQAFSVQRQQGGRTARTGPVHEHPAFAATTDGWDAYLASLLPLGFIVDQWEWIIASMRKAMAPVGRQTAGDWWAWGDDPAYASQPHKIYTVV